MRICLVNTTDSIGGAERCSSDLHRELRLLGHQSSLVVGRKLTDDPDTYPCHYPAWDWKPRAFLHGRTGLTDTTLVTPIRQVLSLPAMKNADVVNLHNMHGCYWNFWTVPLLARSRQVVLTLHDEWLYTGDCVYTYDCDRWKDSCGSCPQMSEYSRPNLGGRDLTRFNLFLKRTAMRLAERGKVQVVTPSKWLAQRVGQSILGRFPVHVIPNGVDLNILTPRNKAKARERLGLDPVRTYFLFLANSIGDPRKGIGLLEKMLAAKGLPTGSSLMIVGNGGAKIVEKFPSLSIKDIGFVSTSDRLADCYSAADAKLLLSRADNLPYTGLEALACGCPVIALAVGGNSEIVEDGVTGRLLPASVDSDCLFATLSNIKAMSQEKSDALSENARKKAERDYDMRTFVRRYGDLFSGRDKSIQH